MDWNGSVVKPPAFEDEGAVHMGNGRFLLSISACEEKEVSGRWRTFLVIAIILVVVAVLVAITLMIGHQRNSIPYKAMLSTMIGSTFKDVSGALGLPRSDWTQLDGNRYALNKACKASGISYKLWLSFDDNGKMNGIEYKAEYQAGIYRAAYDIYKAAEDLGLCAHHYATGEYVQMTPSYLLEHFKQNELLNESFSHKYARLKGVPQSSQESYLKSIDSEHGYVTQPVSIYETNSVEYTPETKTVRIHIIFEVKPGR